MTSLLEGCTSSYLGVFDSLGLQTKASVTVCAPLVLHIHNCKFLFRFPSETSQVQTIKFRRVIKGGECAPGGVGGSSAGLRPGDRSPESAATEIRSDLVTTPSQSGALQPCHPPPTSGFPGFPEGWQILCLSFHC